ncbi:Hsp20/alpha crystallin family protein [Kribbella sp. NPDC003557]|uniref:Hsp20/alpha crystallin family protein n=1 Tax=Kribbella sp. NPDC003557 TaxID=3154449 RepID=UPI0033A2640B
MTLGAVRQPPAVRWLPADPFAHLDDIHHRTRRGLRHLTAVASTSNGPPSAVDVEETTDAFIIELDLPGAAARQVTVQCNGRHLVVRGRIPAHVHAGTLRRHTRYTGPVCHTIRLPEPVQGNNITATLTNGVLTIHAPKARPAPAVCIVDPDTPDGYLP